MYTNQHQTPRAKGEAEEPWDCTTPQTECSKTSIASIAVLRPPSDEKPRTQTIISKLTHEAVQCLDIRGDREWLDHVTEETISATDSSALSQGTRVKSLFNKAYEYLNPGRSFRIIISLYAERKLLVFFLIHFACTMIIWCKYKFLYRLLSLANIADQRLFCFVTLHQFTFSW